VNPVTELVTKKLTRRVYFAGLFVSLWSVGIVYRLVDLQIRQTGQLLGRAQRQNQRVIEVDAKRGIILDRNGHELAISRDLESCYAVPTEIEEPELSAKKISTVLGEPALRKELAEKLSSGKRFVWVKRKLAPEQADHVRTLDIEGIGFVPESKRFDPKSELAGHVLGYVGLDNQGLAGLEYQYDRELRGTPGRVLIEIDARRREFSTTTLTPTRPGQNLVLTVDEVIQFIVENELREAIARHRARSGSIIVCNPRTGEILAMANWPTYDPNDFSSAPATHRRNRAIEDGYEPGSTMKVVVAAGTLEEKTARMEEEFDCQQGSIVLAGKRIRDHKPFGVMRADEIIKHSSNVGAIKLGLRLGSQRLHGYMSAFGFGQPTGVDLPGENPGILRPVKEWSGVSIGALSMGQEVNVTPLQILQMVSTVANNGVLVRPRVVRQIVSPEGKGWSTPQAMPPARVISPETARALREILVDVVEQGTGIAARMDGFSTAGKTGTAQKIDPATGRYASGRYVSSFVGFTPVENPAIAMIVIIDEPVGAYYGGLVAAPIYKVCAERILQHLNIFPERRRAIAPRVVYASLNPGAQVEMVAEGDGLVEPAMEPAAPPRDEPAVVEAVVRSHDGPEFPDLRGKTIREAARVMRTMGVPFEAKGTGYVVAQEPPPGSPLRSASRCRLVLALERQ